MYILLGSRSCRNPTADLPTPLCAELIVLSHFLLLLYPPATRLVEASHKLSGAIWVGYT